MKNVLALAMLAGTALTASMALAQEELSAPIFGGERRVEPIGYPSRSGGYSNRSIQTVYDTLTSSFATGATHLGACSTVIDDISFVPGPFATNTPRLLTEVSWGVGCASANFPAAGYDNLVIFWNAADVNLSGFTGTGTSMIRSTAVPIAVARFTLTGLVLNHIYQYTASLTGFPGGGVTIPSNGCYVQDAWVQIGYTPTTYTDLSAGLVGGCASDSTVTCGFGSNSGAPTGGNPATTGSTDSTYGRNISNAAMCPNIAYFVGDPVGAAAGNVERRTGLNVGGVQLGYMLRLKGEAPVPPPPAFTALGCIPDAGLTRSTDSVAASQVKWYSLCLSGAADDANLHFLDVDTEGSAGDVAIALYDSITGGLAGGNLSGSDDNSGSGTNAQLTFGVGRRAAVGDGLQYDGRSGQLAAGTYYLAVGPSGTIFGDAYTVTPSANAGGPFTLHFATNVNGAALTASATPIINGIDYGTLDPVSGTSAGGVATGTGLRGVIWNKFTLASPVDANHFLDMDFEISGANADGVSYIFNSSGDIMYVADDEGPANLPQFSLGQAGSRTYGTNTVVFDGNTPFGGSSGLAAGTYYVANALYATQDLSALLSGHRFHVRGTSGSSLALGADIYTGGSGGGPVCDSADFDCDGDTGTDFDIQAFFACLGGNCPPAPCTNDADFDNDGDVGTDFDIQAFFRILGGGPC